MRLWAGKGIRCSCRIDIVEVVIGSPVGAVAAVVYFTLHTLDSKFKEVDYI